MKDKSEMFLNCDNLEYINFYNFKSGNINIETDFFKGISQNLVICVNNSKLNSIIESNECFAFSCFDNWLDFKRKINTENNTCTTNCTLTNYKYEYEYKCYQECLNGTYNDNYQCKRCHPDCKECEGNYTKNTTNCTLCSSSDKFLYLGNCIDECPGDSYINQTTEQKICKCELTQCNTCSMDSLNKNLCTSCDTENGYYPLYEDSFNKYHPYFNCSKYPEGYCSDNNNVYKLCYFSCKSCNISGNETDLNVNIIINMKYNLKNIKIVMKIVLIIIIMMKKKKYIIVLKV